MKPTVRMARKIIIAQKPNAPMLLEGHGPGKQKRDFEIEDNEQKRHQVEADVELHAGVVEGVEAAFIGRDLLGVGLADGDDEGRDENAPR